MKPNLDQVVEVLKKEGISDEEVKSFIEGLTKALSAQLYLTIVDNLQKEDLENLEKITDPAFREGEMRKIFQQRSGQNLKSLSDGFIKNFAESFLQDYHSKTGQER